MQRLYKTAHLTARHSPKQRERVNGKTSYTTLYTYLALSRRKLCPSKTFSCINFCLSLESLILQAASTLYHQYVQHTYIFIRNRSHASVSIQCFDVHFSSFFCLSFHLPKCFFSCWKTLETLSLRLIRLSQRFHLIATGICVEILWLPKLLQHTHTKFTHFLLFCFFFSRKINVT